MTSEPAPPVRVSTLELFFDLVFVFTITQVTTVVEESHGAGGLAQAAVELWVIFWMYGGFAWLTNTNKPDTLARRSVLLLAMAAFFVVSLAVPSAYHEGGVVFGFAYLAVVLLHAAGFLVFSGRGAVQAVSRLLPWNVLSAGLVITAGFTHGDAVPLLWVAAAVVQLVSSLVIRVERNFAISARHFGERHGLVILIVLGESLVGVAVASEGEHLGVRLVTGALAGLLVVTAMWWSYFGEDDEQAVEAMAAAPAEARPRRAIRGYFLAHYVMIFGVLLLAAGIGLATEDLLAESSRATAWLVAAGAAAYALGSAGFRLALRFANPVPRAVTGLACLATPALGLHVSTAVELCALAVILTLPTLLR